MLCIVLGLIVVPAASAKGSSATNSDTEIILTATEEKYIVSPAADSSGTEGSSSSGSFSTTNPLSTDKSSSALLSASYITQGKTAYYNAYVGSGVNWIEADLNWGDTRDSLTLTIYTPSGTKVGTYSDSYDGSLNGRLHVNIDPSQGYVAQGNWKLNVYGSKVSGQEDYTLSVARH